MSRVVFWGLLGLILWVPWPLGADRPLPGAAMALWVGILLALWGIFVARRRGAGSRGADRYAMPVALLFATAMIWLAVQTAAPLPEQMAPEAVRQAAALLDRPRPAGIGLNADAAWTTLMRILAYAGVLFLAWEYGRDRADARKIGLTVLIAVIACSIYGLIVQFAGLDSILWFPKTAYLDSVTGPFVNRNSFATYVGIGLVVALAFAVGLLLRRRPHQRSQDKQPNRDWQTALLALAAMLLAVTLVMSKSRGGFYSFALAIVAGGALLVLGGSLRGRKLAVTIAGGVVAITVVLATAGAGLTGRLQQGAASIELSRGAIFGPTLAAIGERPWTGYGLGSFQGVFEAVNNGELYKDGAMVDRAHNTYLEVALEGGVPVAIALALCVLAFVWPCVLAVLRRRSLSFGLGGAVAAAGVGIHAMFDFSLQIPAIVVTVLALLGAYSAQSLYSLGEKS